MPRPETIHVNGLSNREFLEAHARPGRIGLVGGVELINRLIRRTQRHITEGQVKSPWSHAFVFQGRRADGHHWVIESDIDIRSKHIRLGVQENRVSKYYNDADYPCVAILDLGLDEAQAQQLIACGLDLVAEGVKYSLREIAGTVWAMRHPEWRPLANRLEQEKAFYCSAFVSHVCGQLGLKLAADFDVKNTTPHDIAETPLAVTRWILRRQEARRPVARLLRNIKASLKRARR
jgi:hypothetical protein